MIQLTDNEKWLIKYGADYLKKNDVKRFYTQIYRSKDSPEEIGQITQFLLENNINVFDYFTVLPQGMFYGFEQKAIQIPDNIERIGKNCFADCKNLDTILIGNSVRVIDDNAFQNCSSLRKVFLPDSLSILGRNIFDGCSDDLVLIANK